MANEVYTVRGTAHTWTDSTGDSAMGLSGLAASGTTPGRIGAQWDRGAGALPAMFEWRLVIAGFQTSVAVGDLVKLYFALSDGTNIDGIVGTGDGNLASVNILPNLIYAGAVAARSTTISDDIVASGHIYLPSRYISPVVSNAASNALEATSNAHKVILTPIYEQLQ